VIARVRGVVIERHADAVVVDVQGLGYRVTVPRRGGLAEGESVDLYVHTHVREDALTLFGFVSPAERDVFELLITVPSIGPVKAMGILETPIEDIVSLVARGDVRGLSKLPGIGKRTAERMLVDLREKLAALAPSLVVEPGKASVTATDARALQDLVSALTHLGYKAPVVEREAARAVESLGADAGLDALLRHALDQLRRR
jgi:Holliday junction DNA helicase RuvA